MNYYLLVSGILTILMGVAHSVMGELLIIHPLQKNDTLPAVRGSVRHTKRTLRFTWHITSVFGFGVAAVLFRLSTIQSFQADHIFIIRAIAVTFFISFLVSLIGARGKHASWLVFLITAVLTWLSTMVS